MSVLATAGFTEPPAEAGALCARFDKAKRVAFHNLFAKLRPRSKRALVLRASGISAVGVAAPVAAPNPETIFFDGSFGDD